MPKVEMLMNDLEKHVSAILVELYWWRSRIVESKERDKKLIAENEGSLNSFCSKISRGDRNQPPSRSRVSAALFSQESPVSRESGCTYLVTAPSWTLVNCCLIAILIRVHRPRWPG